MLSNPVYLYSKVNKSIYLRTQPVHFHLLLNRTLKLGSTLMFPSLETKSSVNLLILSSICNAAAICNLYSNNVQILYNQ